MAAVLTPQDLRSLPRPRDGSLASLLEAINQLLREHRAEILRGHRRWSIDLGPWAEPVAYEAIVAVRAAGWDLDVDITEDGTRYLNVGLAEPPDDAGISEHERIEIKVSAQSRAFRAAVPGLMAEHAGDWCVWLDGPRHFEKSDLPAQVSWHDAAYKLAYAWALQRLGRNAGFCLSRVEPQRVHSRW